MLDPTDLEQDNGGSGEPKEGPSGARTRAAQARAPWPSGHPQSARLRRRAKTGLGVILMVAVGALLARDAFPGAFPVDVQRLLAALPLVLVALSYLVYQGLRQPGPRELLKAALLASAFVFWAANQLLAQSRVATLLNDIAIVLFALDVFLVIVGVQQLATGEPPHALPDTAERDPSHPAPRGGRALRITHAFGRPICGSPSPTAATFAACT